MSKRSTISYPLFVAGAAIASLAAGILIASCGHSPAPVAQTAPQPSPVDGILTQPAPQPSTGPLDNSGSRQITIYRVTSDDNGSHLAPAPMHFSGATPGDIAVAAINAMSRFGKDDPLPDGAQAKSVTFDGDTATVDFNDAFQKNFSGGDEDEAIVLNSVLSTLGQFPGVKQVQFMVEGKKIGSLGGTQTLSSPLPVPQTIDASSEAPKQTAQAGDSGGDKGQ